MFIRYYLIKATVFILLLLPCNGFADTQSQVSEKTREIQPLDHRAYAAFIQNFDYEAYMMEAEDFFTSLEGEEEAVVILDLRSRAAYDNGHIKSAKHIGADITAEKVAKLVPNRDAKILLYCDNSLYLTRMMSLTHITLPQFHQLGYVNTYMAKELYADGVFDATQILRDKGLWENK